MILFHNWFAFLKWSLWYD